VVVTGCGWAALPAQEPAPTPATAFQRLKEGNERFASNKPATKNLSSARREELAKGQRPFAVVLACADSRVAPELLFDQGLGDLLVVRVAGNVTDPALIGSIEYALQELRAPLVVVLGHEECGAVKAALAGIAPPGNLGELIEAVHVGERRPGGTEESLSAAVRANAVYHAEELSRKIPVVKDFVGSGRARVVAGVYSLQTGKVGWLELPEKQSGDRP
jgi:carbonic anhydrase